MKSTPEQRQARKEQSRTRKLNRLINRLDLKLEGKRVSDQEVLEAIEQHRHIMDSMVILKLDAVRRSS